MYMHPNNADQYYGSSILVPHLTQITIPHTTPSNNCTINYETNFTTTYPACSTYPQQGDYCYQSTCLNYLQKCQPCTFECHTSSCWIPDQQPACVTIMKNHSCNIYYQAELTTYSCSAYYPDAVNLCNQTYLAPICLANITIRHAIV